MNIYESIYLIQMNDFYEMNHLIQYYRPMVTEIWADIFVRKTNTILCERDEFYRHADLLLYRCIFEYRMDRVLTFTSFYRRCTKNKGYDILRQEIRKQCYLNQMCVSLDQKVKEDTNLYYSGISTDDSLEVHEIVMDKLMWEHIKTRIKNLFGEEYVQIVDLRMEGYTFKYIAQELGLSCAKVNFMFEKVKKWYTTIDS
ncbi:hypothetical protein [Holdemanella biformis]|jgi:DNA-directed RNA polymerase specialized sigma24 family protein|uniref:hypothetical protein n=1 Tax=Holdemanella biformis TaxID=1735 RepID=UPI0035656D6B